MINSLESVLNANSDYKRYILKIIDQQNKENEPLSNTVLNSFKLESSRFLVFGKNSQHNSIKNEIKNKSENEFNKNKRRIYNSLTNHVYYAEKVKENLEKKRLEQLKSSTTYEKNESTATNCKNEMRKINSSLFSQDDNNFISYNLNRKNEVFQINNTLIKSTIKPRLKPIVMEYFDSSIVYGNNTFAKKSSIVHSDNKPLNYNNIKTVENFIQESADNQKLKNSYNFNPDMKQRTQPIKIFGKEKTSTDDFAKTKVKTVAELLNLEKNKNVNDEFFLQTYKEEDRNFMKKSNHDTSTNKGNIDLISTNSGFEYSQNKIAINHNNSRNRAKSARLLKCENKSRKIIGEEDKRLYESTKNINQCGANLKLSEKSLVEFTGKESKLSNNCIKTKNYKNNENKRYKKSIPSALDDFEKDEEPYDVIISSNNLKGINSTIDYFNRQENFITETKKKFEQFRKTCSLKNPFFDKNILLDNQRENEREKDVLNEFRNSGIQRDNLEKKSAQIDEQTTTAMHEIINFNSNKNIQITDNAYATEKRKINNLIRDLKGEVKNHPIDLSKIKKEDRKYFTFVKFQKKEEQENNIKRINCDENSDNHEVCCKFDNIRYEKEYNKTKQKFGEYTKTYHERKSNHYSIKGKQNDELDKNKKVLFKNSFSNFNKSFKNFGIYNALDNRRSKESIKNENLFSSEEEAPERNIHQSFKDINKYAKILKIKKVK